MFYIGSGPQPGRNPRAHLSFQLAAWPSSDAWSCGPLLLVGLLKRCSSMSKIHKKTGLALASNDPAAQDRSHGNAGYRVQPGKVHMYKRSWGTVPEPVDICNK